VNRDKATGLTRTNENQKGLTVKAKGRKNIRLVSKAYLVILLFLLSGCAESPSTLEPHGPGAETIAMIGWLMFIIAAAVFVTVMGLLLYALFRPRQEEEEGRFKPSQLNRFVIIGGLIIPLVILIAVYGFALYAMTALAAPADEDELVIEVVGHQWWWEVNYPEQSFTTANEIHIPVGQRVALQVRTLAVIHSFWVPELHGKIDMIPGQTNIFWLEAEEPGDYFGICAEFCGTQHAKMAFVVVAEPQERFQAWLTGQQQPAPEPADPLLAQGRDIFFQLNCDECHIIKGTTAEGRLGPDLTHLAGRQTLAAGIIPNTREHLAGWIINPQNIKPGNLMPASSLDEEELQALLAYLESLQ
jgi:cytochrome c oxidase subunit II